MQIVVFKVTKTWPALTFMLWNKWLTPCVYLWSETYFNGFIQLLRYIFVYLSCQRKQTQTLEDSNADTQSVVPLSNPCNRSRCQIQGNQNDTAKVKILKAETQKLIDLLRDTWDYQTLKKRVRILCLDVLQQAMIKIDDRWAGHEDSLISLMILKEAWIDQKLCYSSFVFLHWPLTCHHLFHSLLF